MLSSEKLYQKWFRKQNPDRVKNYKLKYSFGITLVQYNEMFQAQKGLCLGCYKHQTNFKRAFSVDHDHKTGKIRGLLCTNCNQAVGHAMDSAAVLKRLADYLENNHAS